MLHIYSTVKHKILSIFLYTYSFIFHFVLCSFLRQNLFQKGRPKVDKESPAAALGDPNVLVQIDNVQKAGFFWPRQWNSRELPEFEKGIDNFANNPSDDNLSVHALGKGFGDGRVLQNKYDSIELSRANNSMSEK